MDYYSEQAEQETSSNTFSFLLANHLPISVFFWEVKCNKIGQCTPNVQLLLLSPPKNFGNEALHFALAIVTSY